MAKAKYYTSGKRMWTGKNAGNWEYLPDGRLYANGIYPSKMTKETLPKSFIYVYYLKQPSFLQAAGVVDIVYRPNYWINNHLYKDDCLLISYKEKIRYKGNDITRGYLEDFEGEDITLFGGDIVDFVDAVEKYSNLDVSAIREELRKKRIWYVRTNPAHHEISNSAIDFETKAYFLAREFAEADYSFERQREEFCKFCKQYKLTSMDEPFICRSRIDSINAVTQKIITYKEECTDDYFIVIFPIVKADVDDYTIRNKIEMNLSRAGIVVETIFIRSKNQ